MIERILENLMLRVMKGYSTNSRAYRVYNKHTQMVMESINVVIDDIISEKDIDGDSKGLNLKKNEDDDNMSLGDDAEKESPEKESTPPISRRETRSTQGSPAHSHLQKSNLQSLVMRNLPLPRDHRQK